MIKLALCCLLGISAANLAYAAPALPDYVRVQSLNYAGSGCYAGSVYSNIFNDGRGLILGFDNFDPEVGPGVPLSQSRKNCQLNMYLDYPNGWSFAVAGVRLRTAAILDRGAKLFVSVAHYYSGVPTTAAFKGTLAGPYDNDVFLDLAAQSAPVWSPCGVKRALNLNAQMQITSPPPQGGVVRIPLIDDITKLEVTLTWKRCVPVR